MYNQNHKNLINPNKTGLNCQVIPMFFAVNSANTCLARAVFMSFNNLFMRLYRKCNIDTA